MKDQITIRGLGKDLELRLQAVAREQQTSLNKAAILMMRKGAGLRPENEGPQTVGRSLSAFVGSWSSEKERELLDSIAELDGIDQEFWG